MSTLKIDCQRNHLPTKFRNESKSGKGLPMAFFASSPHFTRVFVHAKLFTLVETMENKGSCVRGSSRQKCVILFHEQTAIYRFWSGGFFRSLSEPPINSCWPLGCLTSLKHDPDLQGQQLIQARCDHNESVSKIRVPNCCRSCSPEHRYTWVQARTTGTKTGTKGVDVGWWL